MQQRDDHPALADILDLIEGQPQSAAGRDRALAALEADPALRQAVAGMRSDRQELRALGAVQAPEDMLERVQAVLEREALLGLASSENEAPSTIPDSRVEYTGPSVIATVFASRWLRPVAAAAAVLLVAAGATMGIRSLMHRSAGTQDLAKRTPPVGLPEDLGNPVESPREVATAEGTRGTSPGGLEVASAANPANADPSDPANQVAKPPRFGMALDRALALAKQGKLVIHLRASSEELATGRVEGLVAHATADRALAKVPGDGQARVLAAAQPPAETLIPRSQPVRGVASANAANSEQATFPAIPEFHPVGVPYAVHFRAAQRSLRELLDALSAGSGCSVVLSECGEPIGPELGPDPAAILWWSSPATWDKRPAAAIILETP